MIDNERQTCRSRFLFADLPAAAGLFVVVLAFFAISLPYQILNWDDQEYIYRNPWIVNLTWFHVTEIFRHYYFSNYHPLTMISYMVDFHLFGYQPWGYRLHNIILHGLCSVAVFAILRSFKIGTLLAVLLAAFFALHPLRIESVVWISERKDVLSGFFFLLAFFLWRVASNGSRRGELPLLVLAILVYTLSLLSKAMAITFPLVVLAHDIMLHRDRMMRRIPLYVVSFALAVLFSIWNLQAQEGAVRQSVPLIERLNNAAWSPLHYTISTLIPAQLSPLYPYAERPQQSVRYAVQGWLFCLVGLALVVGYWRRHPAFAYGLLSAAIVLGPVSGIVAFGSAYAADRYSYLPTAFLLISVGVLLEGFLVRLPARFARTILPLAVPVAAIYAGTTLVLMPVWESSVSVWARVLQIYPDDPKARYNFEHAKLVYGEQGTASAARDDFRDMDAPSPLTSVIGVYNALLNEDFDSALEQARALPRPEESAYWQLHVARQRQMWDLGADAAASVLKMERPTANLRAEAAINFFERGDIHSARELLESIRQPTFLGAELWGRLGRHYIGEGREDEGYSAIRTALLYNPASPVALFEITQYLHRQRRTLEALPLLRRASNHPLVSPRTQVFARVERARILAQTGQNVEALFQEAFDPDLPTRWTAAQRADWYSYAAGLAETANRAADAMMLYEHALIHDGNNIDALSGKGRLYAESGRLHEALPLIQKAASLDPANPAISHNLVILQQLLNSNPAPTGQEQFQPEAALPE